MVQFYEEAEKRGYTCTLLIEPRLAYNGTHNAIRLGTSDKQTAHHNLKSLLLAMPQSTKNFLRPIKNIFFSQLGIDYKNKIQNWINIQVRREQEIETIFDQVKPDIVFTYGDRHGGYEPATIRIANVNNIPVIIPPIAYATGIEGLLVSARKHRDERNSICVTNNAKFKNKYPGQWVHDEETDEDFSYYPTWMVKAREQCGVLPENPWVLGGGQSTIICADGNEAKERYIRNGVKPGKIRVTGHLEHDVMYNTWQNRKESKGKLHDKYTFQSDLPLLLVALPQTWEHNILSEEEHWQLQEYLCNAAVRSKWNVLLSLHPKMELTRYKYLEDKFSIKIAVEKLGEVLPLADLYLVGQGSSTDLWAVLCEVPIIIADWYGLNYTTYNWIEGIRVIKEANKLKEVLASLTSNSSLLETFKKSHLKQKHMVSPFDGNCFNRIYNVTNSLSLDRALSEN